MQVPASAWMDGQKLERSTGMEYYGVSPTDPDPEIGA
jgi:hypothetical protein